MCIMVYMHMMHTYMYLGHGQVKLQQVFLALLQVTVESELLVELEETQERIVLKGLM